MEAPNESLQDNYNATSQEAGGARTRKSDSFCFLWRKSKILKAARRHRKREGFSKISRVSFPWFFQEVQRINTYRSLGNTCV